jgi:hypothetical protein
MQTEAQQGRSVNTTSARVLEATFWFAIAAHVVTAWSTIARYSGYEIAKSYLADDTFYYLVIANNIAQGAGSTFDGEALTNGYHPLWLIICTVVAGIVPHDYQIEVLYGLQGILVAITALLVKQALSRIDHLAAVVAGTLLVVNGAVRFVLMNGMESALGAFLLAALMCFTFRKAADRIVLTDLRERAIVTVLLALLALARIEMAVVGVIYLAIALVQSRSSNERRAVFWVAGCLSLVGLLFVAANLLIAGWPVPISGSVKWAGPETSDVLVRTARMHLASYIRPIAILGGYPLPVELAIAGVLASALIAKAFQDAQFRLVALAICGPCGVFAVVATSRAGGFPWYGWPALLAGAISAFALTSLLLSYFASVWRGIERVPLAASASVTLLLLSSVLCYTRYTSERPSILYDWNAPEVLMDGAISYLEKKVPNEGRLSGTSVGLLSFMSRRAIVQTEGLVNDREYFLALQEGRTAEVLRKRGVGWFFAIVHHRDRRFPEFFDESNVRTRSFLSREVGGVPRDAPDDVQIVRFNW